MSFLGPFEALLPVVEPFLGAERSMVSRIGGIRGVRSIADEYPTHRAVRQPGISTWEKDNSVKVNHVSFGAPNAS